MNFNYTLDNINEAVAQFLQAIGTRKVIALHGQMGAGKTTFTHAVCKALNVTSNISSPTFSIINAYATEDANTIYHIDLYRLKSEREGVNAGVEDCLYSGNLCLVEWPEITPALFPDDTVHCYITAISSSETGGIQERNLTIKMD